MDYQKKHSINKELDNVHLRMKIRYAEYERAKSDIERAKNDTIDSLDVRRTYEPIRISETVEEVFKKSMYQNFVPVVDDDDIFIGIVKRRDVIQYFYNKYIHEK